MQNSAAVNSNLRESSREPSGGEEIHNVVCVSDGLGFHTNVLIDSSFMSARERHLITCLSAGTCRNEHVLGDEMATKHTTIFPHFKTEQMNSLTTVENLFTINKYNYVNVF